MSGQADNRYGDRDDKPLTGVATPVSETKASLTIQTALKLEAKPLGILGDYITVRAVSSGVAGMSISDLTGLGTQASPYLIEIKLGTTTTNNTMTLIGAALTAKTDVAAVINNTIIAGATQMTAFNLTALSGGVNGTAGYKYQVLSDANNTRWELKHIDGVCYYWSPDGFPSTNTEYFHCYCGGSKTYKMQVETTSPSTSPGTRSVNIGVPNYKLKSGLTGILRYSATQDLTFPALYVAQNNGLLMGLSKSVDNIQIAIITGVITGFGDKPVLIDVIYERL